MWGGWIFKPYIRKRKCVHRVSYVQGNFNWVREMMKRYDSRPHWGKVNWYVKEDIYTLYPEAFKFNCIREEQDPYGVFMTDYFK